MAKKSKLVNGMLIGAMVGAAISLLDRDTREKAVENVKSCSKKVWSIAKNPAKIGRDIGENIAAARMRIEEFTEDIHYILEKVNDITASTQNITNKNSKR
ncbi:hypothetical protein [Calidifontibacillus oryziterrae]|uniref:hypothetical protein n=1 Tax=Calidifontibacillus oryziterrae TaxID=1191699 RepID=UPI0002E77CF7|nr:hypothetical protein [Calidifontibacillus oryziterrae]